MPLVVPALRFLLLFLNVYETFKTLQLPERSPRTGERTIRALTQRKRDMKGCMAIWLVWCCFTVYERTFDGIVGLFVPFYNELKAIAYLFQILTRARGAEPLYLHVLRPLIKPYVATLDWSLDLVSTVGDFLLLVITLPYNLFMERWRPTVSEIPPQESSVPTRRQVSSRRTARFRNSSGSENASSSIVGMRVRSSRQNVSTRTSHNEPGGPSRMSSASEQKGHARACSEISSRGKPKALYEVWHPPASIVQAEGRRVVSDSSAGAKPVLDAAAPVTPPRNADQGGLSATEVEEWRKYPPFPSAYPATPHVPSKSLSGSSGPGAANELPAIGEDGIDVSLIELEVEEWRKYEPFPSAYPPTPEVVARTITITKSTSRQSTLDPVEEQKDGPEHVDPSSDPSDESRKASVQKRETRRATRPKPTATQSLPRSRWSGFLSAPERPRESSVEGSHSRYGSGDETIAGSQHEGETYDNDEHITNQYEEDGDVVDSDLDLTLQTPARPSRRSPPKRVQSPPLSVLGDMDEDPATMDQVPSLRNFGSASGLLSVPSATSRTNSNYTLSSYRNSWASSQSGSLTTHSGGSSLRTSVAMSKAPSTQSVAPSMSSRGSRNSSRASASEASDSSSIVGVKRPLSAVTESTEVQVGARKVKRAVSKTSLSRVPSERGANNPVRAVASSSRSSRFTRASQKRDAVDERPDPIERASDTLESSEGSMLKAAPSKGLASKRRRMGPAITAATSRLDRAPSTLEKVPEETSVFGKRSRRK